MIFMKRMKKKRTDNKGFSLVELIIVIAIMAILIGIVGTQVVPYLNRAREERDMQIIDAFATAAVTFYSLNTDVFAHIEQNPSTKYTNILIQSGGVSVSGNLSDTDRYTPVDYTERVRAGFKELTGYANISEVSAQMSSAVGKSIVVIEIHYDFKEGTVTAQAYNNMNRKDTDKILEAAVAYIGKPQ